MGGCECKQYSAVMNNCVEGKRRVSINAWGRQLLLMWMICTCNQYCVTCQDDSLGARCQARFLASCGPPHCTQLISARRGPC